MSGRSLDKGTGCEFKVSPELFCSPEPEQTPLRTRFEMFVIGLREVKGGSFGIDLQYVLDCSLKK